MIDLETLDNKPNSAILSIGAVFFDASGLGKEFYINVDLEDSIKNGFDFNADTFYWWLGQSNESQKALIDDRIKVATALHRLKVFILENSDYQTLKVWGNGSDFDNVILSNAFNKVSQRTPWNFWNNRCFRTFVDVTGAERVKPTTAHNALEDAKAQAQTLINYWKL